MNINNRGSLMTVTQDGKEFSLGYLINFTDRGIFSPCGKVEVTPAEMGAHNDALSNAEIEGLDKNCQVGQYGTFYYVKGQVQTFIGKLVSDQVRVRNNVITFTRANKVYRGRLQKDADMFNFRRVS